MVGARQQGFHNFTFERKLLHDATFGVTSKWQTVLDHEKLFHRFELKRSRRLAVPSSIPEARYLPARELNEDIRTGVRKLQAFATEKVDSVP